MAFIPRERTIKKLTRVCLIEAQIAQITSQDYNMKKRILTFVKRRSQKSTLIEKSLKEALKSERIICLPSFSSPVNNPLHINRSNT